MTNLTKEILLIFIIIILVTFSIINFYFFHFKFFTGYKGPSLIINPFISVNYGNDIDTAFKNFYSSCAVDKLKPTILVDDFTYQYYKSKPNIVPLTYSFLSFNIIKNNKKFSFEQFVNQSVKADCATAKCGTFKTFLLSSDFRVNDLCFYNFMEND